MARKHPSGAESFWLYADGTTHLRLLLQFTRRRTRAVPAQDFAVELRISAHTSDVMKHALKASRRIRAPAENPPITSIWITDRLLNETFRRFAGACGRYNSHVPGPLEARRRATRRKNTSLAFAGASRAPPEASDLFGSGPHAGWWTEPQAVNEVEQIGKLSLFRPKWFARPPPPPQPALQHIVQSERQKAVRSRSKVLQDQSTEFRSRLSLVRTPDEVRSLIKVLGLDLCHHPILSRSAFRHFLDANMPGEGRTRGCQSSPVHIIEFLLDPTLNTLGSRNCIVLIHHLRRESFPKSIRRQCLDAIYRAISLGMVPPNEIKSVISALPRILSATTATPVPSGAAGKPFHHYGQVLNAIQQCRVLDLSDLGEDYLLSCLSSLDHQQFSYDVAFLKWRLRKYDPKSETDVASALVRRWLGEGEHMFPKELNEEALAGFLDTLPAPVLARALVRTTKFVVLSAARGDQPRFDYQAVVQWHHFLSRLGPKTVRRAFGQKSEWEGLADTEGSPHERAQNLLITSWTAISLSRLDEFRATLLKKIKLRTLFEECFPGAAYSKSNAEAGGSRDVLAQVLEILQTLPLSHTHLLLRRLCHLTGWYLVPQKTDYLIQNSLKAMRSHDFSLFQDDREYLRIKRDFNDELVDLAETINGNLPEFARISRGLIWSDKKTFRIVTRALRHNLALHHALSQSSPGRQLLQGKTEPVNLRISSSPNTAIDTKTLDISSNRQPSTPLDPREVLALMHHLAISFATSSVVTPRQSVRQVYWCFQMLHRYGAPIERPIIRALWYAGVTRYAETGTATTLLRWILKQVRLVEGDRMAKMLLVSTGFRQLREKEFRSLRWVDDETMPEELEGSMESMQDGIDTGQNLGSAVPIAKVMTGEDAVRGVKVQTSS